MSPPTSVALLALLYASAVPNLASADTCTYQPHNIESYDQDIASLWNGIQVYTDDAWSRFHMDEGDWDDGFGYEDPSNEDTPLKRTLNALMLLAYATTNTPTCSTQDGNVGHWAYCWAGEALDELDGSCGDGENRAWTQWLPGFQYTELYWPFFYDETVVQRASTIIHEARHAHGWCAHEGSCPRGTSCDPSFQNGCVGIGSGDGLGANAMQVIWLQWYLNSAQPEWGTEGLRNSAFLEATEVLSKAFEIDPGFRVASDGTAVNIGP